MHGTCDEDGIGDEDGNDDGDIKNGVDGFADG